MSTLSYPEFPIKLTDRALEMVLSAKAESDPEEGDVLRVSVKGGGCAGLKYSLNFVNKDKVDALDMLTNITGLEIVLDVFSALHLKDTLIDYTESEQGEGFVFENPHAQRSCGCGSSFST